MNEPLPKLPSRDPAGHKGTFGTVVVVGGQDAQQHRMIGAPALSALGALRSGSGLVKLLMPGSILNAAIAMLPSATGIVLPVDESDTPRLGSAAQVLDQTISQCDAIAIGPGIGDSAGAQSLVLRTLQQDAVPVVVDADGLNCLAQTVDLWRDFHAQAILTPHPGEFKRLASSLRISRSPVDPKERPAAAAELAQRLGCIVVLKGAGTVVSNGLDTWVCSRGHPCMATAGTGDVLTGVIASLAGQYSRVTGAPLTLYDVARLGVQAHAIAGELWAQSHKAQAGMLATELADHVPSAIESMR